MHRNTEMLAVDNVICKHKVGSLNPWVCRSAVTKKTYYVFPDGEVEMSLDFALVTKEVLEPEEWMWGDEVLFEANITHNLTDMADEAGIYEVLWHPNENGYIKAKEIINKLMFGLADMRDDPEKYKKHDAPNGWGTYENFVQWVQKVLDACQAHPDAYLYTST